MVDADIKGFFGHLSHDWMMEFLKLYIKDPNLLWLINKYLKAGVMTDGVFEESEEGLAQGNIISPRSNEKVKVNPDKVFPCNLRHLFARTLSFLTNILESCTFWAKCVDLISF